MAQENYFELYKIYKSILYTFDGNFDCNTDLDCVNLYFVVWTSRGANP